MCIAISNNKEMQPEKAKILKKATTKVAQDSPLGPLGDSYAVRIPKGAQDALGVSPYFLGLVY